MLIIWSLQVFLLDTACIRVSVVSGPHVLENFNVSDKWEKFQSNIIYIRNRFIRTAEFLSHQTKVLAVETLDIRLNNLSFPRTV